MHKVCVLPAVAGMHEGGVCKEDAEKEEERERLCTAVVCWNESEQAVGGGVVVVGESFGMHMRVCEGWRQLGIGLQGFFGGPGSLRS